VTLLNAPFVPPYTRLIVRDSDVSVIVEGWVVLCVSV
jgi:hypothetical protein